MKDDELHYEGYAPLIEWELHEPFDMFVIAMLAQNMTTMQLARLLDDTRTEFYEGFGSDYVPRLRAVIMCELERRNPMRAHDYYRKETTAVEHWKDGSDE